MRVHGLPGACTEGNYLPPTPLIHSTASSTRRQEQHLGEPRIPWEALGDKENTRHDGVHLTLWRDTRQQTLPSSRAPLQSVPCFSTRPEGPRLEDLPR